MQKQKVVVIQKASVKRVLQVVEGWTYAHTLKWKDGRYNPYKLFSKN